MTEAQVSRLVETAKEKHGVSIDRNDAQAFLGAEEILAQDPDNLDALTVVRNFSVWMRTGVEPRSFAQFSLPIPYTDEEVAAMELSRSKYLAATGQRANEVSA
jgi:hypothetical protein